MNKEKLNDSTIEYKNNENNVSSGASKVTHNPKRLSFEHAGSSQQAPKKAKKSLEAGWDSSTASDISYLIETPVSFSNCFVDRADHGSVNVTTFLRILE